MTKPLACQMAAKAETNISTILVLLMNREVQDAREAVATIISFLVPECHTTLGSEPNDLLFFIQQPLYRFGIHYNPGQPKEPLGVNA